MSERLAIIAFGAFDQVLQTVQDGKGVQSAISFYLDPSSFGLTLLDIRWTTVDLSHSSKRWQPEYYKLKADFTLWFPPSFATYPVPHNGEKFLVG